MQSKKNEMRYDCNIKIMDINQTFGCKTVLKDIVFPTVQQNHGGDWVTCSRRGEYRYHRS